MANTVAYPDLALEKFFGIHSSENPTAFIHLLEKKISFSLGSRPATNESDFQIVYDDRKEALFGSLLRGPAAEWLDSLEVALTWDEIKKRNTSLLLVSLTEKCSTDFESKLKI